MNMNNSVSFKQKTKLGHKFPSVVTPTILSALAALGISPVINKPMPKTPLPQQENINLDKNISTDKPDTDEPVSQTCNKETEKDRAFWWLSVYSQYFYDKNKPFQHEISKAEIENIFRPEDGFKLSYAEYPDSNCAYVYIKTANNVQICSIQGKLGSNKYGVPYYGILSEDSGKKITGVELFIDIINKNLDIERQRMIYNNPVFCVKEPTKEELEDIHKLAEVYIQKFQARQEAIMRRIFPNTIPVFISHELEEQLNNKPVYGEYVSNGEKSISSVAMREYLTVNATNDVQYIGTMGCGPCIGLAMVSKTKGKPNKITVAHIDAQTNLESDINSLKDIIEDIFRGSNALEITLIASKGEYDMAKRILSMIPESILGKTRICSELNRFSRFAVNTKTGEVCIDIPIKDFDLKEDIPKVCYYMPTPLHESAHYKNRK